MSSRAFLDSGGVRGGAESTREAGCFLINSRGIRSKSAFQVLVGGHTHPPTIKYSPRPVGRRPLHRLLHERQGSRGPCAGACIRPERRGRRPSHHPPPYHHHPPSHHPPFHHPPSHHPTTHHPTTMGGTFRPFQTSAENPPPPVSEGVPGHIRLELGLQPHDAHCDDLGALPYVFQIAGARPLLNKNELKKGPQERHTPRLTRSTTCSCLKRRDSEPASCRSGWPLFLAGVGPDPADNAARRATSSGHADTRQLVCRFLPLIFLGARKRELFVGGVTFEENLWGTLPVWAAEHQKRHIAWACHEVLCLRAAATTDPGRERHDIVAAGTAALKSRRLQVLFFFWLLLFLARTNDPVP